MSRKSVTIEVDVDEYKAYEVVMNELLYERSLLKKRGYVHPNKKQTIEAFETVLDYFCSDWRKPKRK